jgi:GntR family transcriptional regulator, phosphonate transport system regulatory protein
MPTSDFTGSPPLQRQRSGVTVWKQIAETLEREIRERRYAAEGCLPSEPLLAARFQVARHTIRQALATLREQGLLRIEQGRGAFIQTTWLDYTLQRRTRFSQNLMRQAQQPQRQLLSAREDTASSPVARALALRKGAPVVMAELLQLAGKQPLGVATMYFPAARLGGMQQRLLAGEGVTEALTALGVADYHRVRSHVTAHMPDEAVAKLLCQPTTHPVLSVESVDADEAGVPIKYGVTIFSADRVKLVVGLDDA